MYSSGGHTGDEAAGVGCRESAMGQSEPVDSQRHTNSAHPWCQLAVTTCSHAAVSLPLRRPLEAVRDVEAHQVALPLVRHLVPLFRANATIVTHPTQIARVDDEVVISARGHSRGGVTHGPA
eukprot:scaffold37401_cov25-Tisochrysis_lutea.AAC.3